VSRGRRNGEGQGAGKARIGGRTVGLPLFRMAAGGSRERSDAQNSVRGAMLASPSGKERGCRCHTPDVWPNRSAVLEKPADCVIIGWPIASPARSLGNSTRSERVHRGRPSRESLRLERSAHGWDDATCLRNSVELKEGNARPRARQSTAGPIGGPSVRIRCCQ